MGDLLTEGVHKECLRVLKGATLQTSCVPLSELGQVHECSNSVTWFCSLICRVLCEMLPGGEVRTVAIISLAVEQACDEETE